MSNPVFDFWLAQEGDREIGFAFKSGQSSDPVFVWQGSWYRHPNGLQDADIKSWSKEAFRLMYEGSGAAPRNGDRVIVYYDDTDSVTVSTYEYTGDDDDEEEYGDDERSNAWEEIEEKEVDLQKYIADQVEDVFNLYGKDGLLEAAKYLDIVDISE